MKRVQNTVIGLSLLALLVGLVGCEATAKSDMCEPGWQKTPSYVSAMSAEAKPTPIKARDWNDTSAKYALPGATHFPSWFLDPIVMNGDGDDTYGWTCYDLWASVYSPCRFVVNLVALPVSMIKEPPGVLVCTSLDQNIDFCPVNDCAASPTEIEVEVP